ncbi:bifunctional 4-alpha-glucanotransferase/amylo-alpha-1,6-glucosidase [Entomophthora muscae]|uniref:Bifunctional 4-alpha-glucanotransferase/amylo-alpha-1,6-glucosidase n=1 Tax=Entomophthora muscae TaxID=34485 RepID=A0ACC2U2A2_9FUNG|nr:bifunctional 4-alpha-glucanotransferase/amylo-alpha-1,6-glucosidase [Entomophthora muscae]
MPVPTMKEALTVYCISLGEDGSPQEQDKLIRLPPAIKPYGLRIKLPSGSDASQDGVLLTNYPIKTGEFNRNHFTSVDFLVCPSGESYCDFKIERAGIFEYRVEYGNKKASSTGYIIVDPSLETKGNPLPLDSINLLSVVPKWLGPINQWKPHFEAAAKLEYNLIHFVPLQQRGGSNSPYSIFDQLQLSKDLFLNEEKDPYASLGEALGGIRREQGLLGLIDMVWNHTASDSHWLWDHPEACYNIENSPHLRPAFELDTAIIELSRQLSDKPLGQIKDEQGIDAVMRIIRETTLPQLKLYEYYVIDVQGAVNEFRNACGNGGLPEEVDPCLPVHDIRHLSDAELGTRLAGEVVERHGVRFGKHIPLAKVFPLLRVRLGFRSVLGNLEEAASIYKIILDAVNSPFYAKYDDDVAAILTNTTNHMRFQRLADNGPRYHEVSAEVPLVQTYFTRLPANEHTAHHSPDALAIASNGWVWAADPKVDFASPRSSAYLRREVIVWGDCAKLRYGKAPEDNPWLWGHMREYTEKMASLFDGFRIDNCHSTPVPLAAYLLDAARRINPNLYVVAELFTGSEETDKDYVCKLGINSLIREAMQAGDPHELSRLIHRYGGLPVGSLDKGWCAKQGSFLSAPCHLIPVRGTVTHSLFMDCTHDNETPTQKRTTIDALPNAALVGMAYCATGSVKGYDEAYPKLLELVSEKRHYQKLDDTLAVGIGRAKKLFNGLHRKMCLEGYTEVHVHQEEQYIMVHRQNPQSHQGYLLIAHTAYKGTNDNSSIKPVILRGTSAEFVAEYRLHASENSSHADATELCGLDVKLEEPAHPELIPGSDHLGPWVEVGLKGFSRGSVLILKTALHDVDTTLTSKIGAEANKAVADLSVDDINVLLYRCHEEEQEMLGSSRGVYEVPGVGRLPYCGLQGFVSVLKPVMVNNDLGHAICDHLRQGRWALGYTIERLELHCSNYPALSSVVNYLKEQSTLLGPLPPFLFPKYFSILVFSLYQAAVTRALDQMNDFVRQGDEFIRGLAMCSVQLNGRTKSTGLHPTKTRPCLAAGLPHFATHHMRCWGRDTFIALRGLFLCTGQHEEARAHILAYAGSLRHGLIPNLLDSLRSPRYNARDATWWFLQSVQDYCSIVPDGLKILQEQVPRRFPDGDSYVDSEKGFTSSNSLSEIIQEILQRHAQGIRFREWNAGPNLDSHMQEEGFEVDIYLDLNTGFLHGGNLYNCGTWMDKMGESVKAGSMGKPATPRDGAPVEITGLLKSTLRWLTLLASDGCFPYYSVKTKDGHELKYSDWNALIQKNFDAHYFIPEDSTSPHVQEDLVNRRGIYKDVVGSKIRFADYQLRPNFSVAMAVAPELFNPEHARLALAVVDEVLVAPLGMKTLDPSDWNYRGDYDNSNDSHDITIAKGFNYHQGPEWGWCLGYYLRASMNFSLHNKGSHQLAHTVHKRLRGFKSIIKTSLFAGLPELTNFNGKFCPDSCASQSWSASATLDTLYDLSHIHS